MGTMRPPPSQPWTWPEAETGGSGGFQEASWGREGPLGPGALGARLLNDAWSPNGSGKSSILDRGSARCSHLSNAARRRFFDDERVFFLRPAVPAGAITIVFRVSRDGLSGAGPSQTPGRPSPAAARAVPRPRPPRAGAAASSPENGPRARWPGAGRTWTRAAPDAERPSPQRH